MIRPSARGRVFSHTAYAPWLMATLHPSAILRMPDELSRQRAWRGLVEDLGLVRQQLEVARRRA